LLNPLISLPLLKGYILDPGRIQRSNLEQLNKFRDKALQKILKYAYKVPLYHEKYKKAEIHPSDIKGIRDIVKLPFVTNTTSAPANRASTAALAAAPPPPITRTSVSTTLAIFASLVEVPYELHDD